MQFIIDTGCTTLHKTPEESEGTLGIEQFPSLTGQWYATTHLKRNPLAHPRERY